MSLLLTVPLMSFLFDTANVGLFSWIYCGVSVLYVFELWITSSWGSAAINETSMLGIMYTTAFETCATVVIIAFTYLLGLRVGMIKSGNELLWTAGVAGACYALMVTVTASLTLLLANASNKPEEKEPLIPPTAFTRFTDPETFATFVWTSLVHASSSICGTAIMVRALGSPQFKHRWVLYVGALVTSLFFQWSYNFLTAMSRTYTRTPLDYAGCLIGIVLSIAAFMYVYPLVPPKTGTGYMRVVSEPAAT